MSNLLAFPDLVIFNIYAHLDNTSWFTLRATCRRFYQLYDYQDLMLRVNHQFDLQRQKEGIIKNNIKKDFSTILHDANFGSLLHRIQSSITYEDINSLASSMTTDNNSLLNIYQQAMSEHQ